MSTLAITPSLPEEVKIRSATATALRVNGNKPGPVPGSKHGARHHGGIKKSAAPGSAAVKVRTRGANGQYQRAE
jgi:hypothetical protein